MASLKLFSRGPRVLAPIQRIPESFVTQVAIRSHTTYQWSPHVRKEYRRVRPFHESEKQQWRSDNLSLDFAYMPQHTLEEAAPPEIQRIPLLPHQQSTIPRAEEDLGEAIDSVIRPEISTISANSTHIESPSAMSEVTDNHAIDLDPYNLSSKVTAAANRTAEDALDKIKEAGTVRQLWSGLLDDLFGSKQVSRA